MRGVSTYFGAGCVERLLVAPFPIHVAWEAVVAVRLATERTTLSGVNYGCARCTLYGRGFLHGDVDPMILGVYYKVRSVFRGKNGVFPSSSGVFHGSGSSSATSIAVGSVMRQTRRPRIASCVCDRNACRTFDIEYASWTFPSCQRRAFHVS